VVVYSIAYTADGDDCYAAVGADVGGTIVTQYRGKNNLESPSLGAEEALKEIATPGNGYFYDLPDPTSLTGIFQQIAANIAGGSSRIVQ
jgi:hypothetical protein